MRLLAEWPWLRRQLATAERLGMWLSDYLDGAPEDRGWAEAWRTYDDTACPRCGVPAAIATDPDVRVDTTIPAVDHVCRTLDDASDPYEDDPDRPHLRFGVRLEQ